MGSSKIFYFRWSAPGLETYKNRQITEMKTLILGQLVSVRYQVRWRDAYIAFEDFSVNILIRNCPALFCSYVDGITTYLPFLK